MNNKTIQLIIILAVLLTVAITISQFIFLHKAFEFQESVSNRNITVALNRVRREILQTYNENANQDTSGIRQLSSKYFVVNMDHEPEPKTLKKLLKKEFERMDIDGDFQFAIYDTIQKKLIFGDYIISSDKSEKKAQPVPGLPRYNYAHCYFCIYFPFKNADIFRQMGSWIILSLLLLFGMLFFAYSVYAILKQKRLSEVQKDFINNMTHEFQTPISTISISSEALMDPKMIESKERIINYACIIHDEASRLKKQVETILQIARIDKEKLSLNKEVINVSEYVTKAVEKVQSVTTVNSRSFTLSFKDRASEILADPIHFHNIIFNLIENAVKYSNENPAITIETSTVDNKIKISVADNGIGIDKKEAKKIFDKFYRISDKNILNIRGFGIGLYYVRMMVQAHGGQIYLQSELRKGSTFSIYMNKYTTQA
jgi:two-component system phosphate regulon sensor histidine kinase PhoR